MPQILLADGKVTNDPRLDRIYPGVEAHLPSLRYLAMEAPNIVDRPFRSYTWGIPHWLDQGAEGRCVEYAICHELLARPVMIERKRVDDILRGKQIYWPAQEEDVWPGGSYPGATPFYEGTSVLAGMKVAARLGFFQEYRWGLNARELALMIGYKGPSVLGINWYTGMFSTDPEGFVHVTGQIEGGHGILCHSVKIRKQANGSLDPAKTYFVLHNSWGPSWGVDGRCKVSYEDMERLISEQGEVALPVRRTR